LKNISIQKVQKTKTSKMSIPTKRGTDMDF